MKRAATEGRRKKQRGARVAGCEGPDAPATSGPSHAAPAPAKLDRDIPALLDGAFVLAVGLGPVLRELNLDLVVGEVARGATAMHDRARFTLRFRAVENIQQLAVLLLRRRLKPVHDFVDQVLGVSRTNNGWTLHLRRAGWVAVRTQQDPALVG